MPIEITIVLIEQEDKRVASVCEAKANKMTGITKREKELATKIREAVAPLLRAEGFKTEQLFERDVKPKDA